MSSEKDIQAQLEFRKMKRLEYLFNDSRSWPTCFEKSLITIIYYTSLDTQKKSNIRNLKSILLKDCDILLDRLNIEGIQDEDNRELIENLKSDINNNNEQSCHNKMKETLKSLRSLDISMIKELTSKIENACNNLKNEDLILFLGKYILSK